ncbi:MAG: hypothetical protein SGJ04_09210 [Bacteroidota bacterium]|nr:hypothetical protein [Bacteroidota bacterium]
MEESATAKTQKWLPALVHKLEIMKLQLDTQTATEETLDFNKFITENDPDNKALFLKNIAEKYFIERILIDYLSDVKDLNISKIAFNYQSPIV